MNNQKIKYLIFTLIFPVFFIECSEEITSYQQASERALISVERIADRFGNHDEIVSADEISFVEDYFSKNGQAWTVSNHFDKYGTTVPAIQITKYLFPMDRAYADSSDLRNAYQGRSIKTPVVGICKIIKDHNYFVTELYS
ncbi:MAG TPA: hypothetical protein PKN04_17075, partial [bacterium]|nr:hypothetical protein [bacterium]